MHLSVVSTFFEVGSLNYTLGYISLYFLALGLPRQEDYTSIYTNQ